MVDEQQLQHTVLGLLDSISLGVDDHAFAHREHARWLSARTAAGVDFDQTHAAHAHRRHARVIAETRHIDARVFARVDQIATRFGVEHLAVDGDRRTRGWFWWRSFGFGLVVGFGGVTHADATGITRRSDRVM